MIGKGSTKFKLVMNEKWHMEDVLGIKYKIISKPKMVEGGYSYTIKEYEENN